MRSIQRLKRGAMLTVALGATLAVSSVGALAQDATPAPYTPGTDLGSLSGSIAADGSSTVGPITQAVAEEFTKQASGVQVKVDISGTGGGFKRFCNGETDVQDASRPIKDPDEVKACADKGIKYFEYEVAYDGVTLVVNSANDFIDCMTVDQLKQLWQKDSTVKTWKDLNPDWPDKEVSLYGPGTDSGTFDYFTEVINGEQGVSREDYTPSEDDNVLVEGVAGDENALGYFGFAYYANNTDKLKAVKVDNGNGCVGPSKDTIRDSSYAPLSRPLFIYINADSLASKPQVQEFLRFYIASAPALVDDVGFVDAPTDIYVKDQKKVEDSISGAIQPDGPGASASPAATP
ncbi:MAG: PstS family phosphate ABC transporter substrate-binding protein [Thermomicrobiales bacterium]